MEYARKRDFWLTLLIPRTNATTSLPSVRCAERKKPTETLLSARAEAAAVCGGLDGITQAVALLKE